MLPWQSVEFPTILCWRRPSIQPTGRWPSSRSSSRRPFLVRETCCSARILSTQSNGLLAKRAVLFAVWQRFAGRKHNSTETVTDAVNSVRVYHVCVAFTCWRTLKQFTQTIRSFSFQILSRANTIYAIEWLLLLLAVVDFLFASDFAATIPSRAQTSPQA